MKSEDQVRAKLSEILAVDATIQPAGMTPGGMIFSKAAMGKVLLWVLGENDDDRWFIPAKPGPPELMPKRDSAAEPTPSAYPPRYPDDRRRG
jgi:hypothetical protein